MPRLFLFVLAISLTASPAFSARHRVVAPPRTGVGMAEVARVFIVVLENEDATVALQQPFLASLAASGALLRNYHAVGHPSLPNYIAMIGGSTFGIVDDNPVTIDALHLGDLFDDAGVSWKVYAEDYPGPCFLGQTYSDGDPGMYVRRHVPFLSFADVQKDPRRCAHIVNDSQFDLDVGSGSLPQFAMYIPDTVHDGHDVPLSVADLWLQFRFRSLLADPSFSAGLLFIVVFDEGKPAGPNVVYCSMNGAGVRPGTVSYAPYDHYSLLRTIEEIFRCRSLGRRDVHADVISDVWRE